MTASTFYWHDYETWGSAPAVDFPAQFAGIRSDAEFRPVGEPLVIYCRPPEDRLPAPEACLITGITPQHARNNGLSEREFIARIHAEISRPGTCTAGYNSIRFDDEVSRYALYRNFYDPYSREWRNGNSRWDLIDVMRLCRALRPDGINWPLREDGTPGFRLEDLTAANGLGHTKAHDALSDVEATMALASLLRSKQPRLFDYALQMRDKRRVSELLNWKTGKPVLHVSGMIPAQRHCAALMMPLAQHPTNRNAVICFDLSADPEALLSLDAAAASKRVFSKQADLEEGQLRIPLKEIHINRCPMVATSKLLDADAEKRLGIDMVSSRKHWQQLRQAEGLSEKLRDMFASREFDNADDPELQLYGGFFGDRDRGLIEQVPAMDAEQLAQGLPFDDGRLPELLFRYRARNFPESLTAAESRDWRTFCRQRIETPVDARLLSLDAYRQRLQQLAETHQSEQDQLLLKALEQWPDEVMA